VAENLLGDFDSNHNAIVPVEDDRVSKVPLSQYWVILKIITVPLSQ
jgi:hypothetical protein